MHPEDRAAWFVVALILAVFGTVDLDELAELLASVAPVASA
jgi:hypothetical protein